MSNTKQPTYEELMEMLQKERSKNAQLLKTIEKNKAVIKKREETIVEKETYIANFKEVVALS